MGASETNFVQRKVGNAWKPEPARPLRSRRCVTKRMVTHAPAVPRVSTE